MEFKQKKLSFIFQQPTKILRRSLQEWQKKAKLADSKKNHKLLR